MILEQGRIIEFDRYVQSFFLLMMRNLTTSIVYRQACHLVEKLNVRILFIVQSNGKRRICKVERNGRSLDRSPNSLFMFLCLSLSCNIQLFSHFVNTQKQIESLPVLKHLQGRAETTYFYTSRLSTSHQRHLP